MAIAWTSLFHAIFYRRGRKPWYVRSGSSTRAEFCIYDELHESYGYTEAWVKFLLRKLSRKSEFDRVMSWKPR